MAALLVARRELHGFFSSSLGYIVLAVVLALHSVWFNVLVLNPKSTPFSAMEQHFYHSSGWIAVVAAVTAMRLFAEEAQTGTLVFLQTSPLSEAQLVAGKWLGGFGFFSIYLLLSMAVPLRVLVTGEVSAGHFLVGTLGLWLLGGAVLALGTLASSVTRHQLVALILGLVVTGLLFLCWLLASKTDGVLSDVVNYLDLMNRHYRSFSRGILKSSTIVYYVSIIYLSLLSATAVLIGRRWRG